MMTTLQTDVLIIGAGPTGLMAANQLRRFGIDFIIIDSKCGPTNESRAIAVTPRTLEVYQQMGLVDHVLQNGERITSFSIFRDGRLKSRFEIGEIGQGISEFSYMFAFEQSKNEELLYDHLKHQGADVLWETELQSLAEEAGVVKVEAIHKQDQIILRALYVIGCDGARSPVRHQLGIPFKGGTYENKFFVVDASLNWNLGYQRLIIAPGDRNFCGFFPLKGDKAVRVLGTLPDEYRDADEVPISVIEKVVKETIGIEMTFEHINWFSTYKLHHRCVETFSKGKVFLAGDSAHIHSPAGGQGMNTGLQDAYNLGWKLAFVLKKWAHPEILNTYNEERLPFAEWLMKFTDRAFNIMTSDQWFIIRFRKYIALNFSGFLIRQKWIRPYIFKVLSQIWYSYAGKSLSVHSSKQPLKFQAGDRLPYFDPDDSGHGWYENFKEAKFHLLHLSSVPLEKTKKESIRSLFSFPVQFVEREITPGWMKYGVKKELFILIRPDNYIAWVTDTLDLAECRKKLNSYFRM